MKEKDIEPAKVIGKMDLKKDEKHNDPSVTGTTGHNSGGLPTATEAEDKGKQHSTGASGQTTPPAVEKVDGTQNNTASGGSPSQSPPTQEISAVSSANNPSGSTPGGVAPRKDAQPLSSAEPPAMGNSLTPIAAVSVAESLDPYIRPLSGVIGPPEVILSEDLLKETIGGIWSGKVESGLDETGRLVAAQKFENDPAKIFARGRTPGVIFAQISKLTRGKIDPRRIGESTRAAGVDLELKQAGLPIELSHWKRVQIGRLPDKADRMLLAREAHENQLTVEAMKRRVSELSGKGIPEDTRRSKAVLRQLQTARNLLADQETRFFVSDKERLKQTLGQDDRSDMLKHAVAARKNVGAINQLLVDLENALIDIEVSERRKKPPEDENADGADPYSS